MKSYATNARRCFKPLYGVLLFLLVSHFSTAQNKPPETARETPVEGRITDEKGEGIASASVMVKGSKTAVSAGQDGAFTISARIGKDVLIVSAVGYVNREMAVKSNHLTIMLTSQNKTMEDVVVIGYGSQRRPDVTAAIASMNTKGIEERPVTRIDQAMIGQMPGVQVRQQTSAPGAGFSIVVRGAGSISAGTEPLYVLDGFPLDVVSQNTAGGFSNGNPLNNLNPDDIESIQVLKDAAAGAIYGSRAANGVVLITTKRGQIGKARLSVNAHAGISQAARKMDLLSPEEWIAQETEYVNYKWVHSATTGRTADQTNAQRRAILGLGPNAYNAVYIPDDRWSMPGHPGLEYVNWQDSIFRTAPFQNYEVSASGGTENVRYFASGSYLNQSGVLLNSGFRNYSARANVEVTASKRFKLGFNLAPSYSVINSPSAEGKDNQMQKVYSMVPVVEDTAGILTGAGKNAVYGWAISSVSPVAFFNNTINTTKTSRTLYSIYGDLQILDGLSARSTLNYDESNQQTKTYISDYVAGNVADRLNSPGKNSSGTYLGFRKQNFVNENTLNYNKTFHEAHTIAAVAGVSYNWVHLENFTIKTAGGFANDLVNTLNNAIPNSGGVTTTATTTESNNVLFSYYGRVQYGYKGRYLVSGSVRRDASSRFGRQSRWGTFPSVTAGWRISEERFMQGVSFVNDLKLRFSYGKAGNNNIGDYAAVPTLISGTVNNILYGNYSFGGNNAVAATGQIPNGLANALLEWETAATYDAGLDASLLNNRVNIIFDLYQKTNSNLLLNIPVPGATGANTILENIGAVRNRGLELAVNAVPLVIRGFQWTINANIAWNQNRVMDLGNGGAPINIPSNGYGGNPPFLMQKGLPMYSYYVIKTHGLLTQSDLSDPKVTKLPKEEGGDPRYVDAKPDGIIDANDRVVGGQPTPKYTWGWTNTFRYKNFDLGIQVYGQHGGSILSYIGRAIDNPTNGAIPTDIGLWRDRWTPANQNFNAPRGKIGISYTIPYVTSDWIYSSDFWRIQNITLGYNLKSVIRTGAISSARVYASALNFFSKDKYKGGVNPEAQNTNLSGNSSYPLPGDYGALPLNKSLVMGLSISF